jgi:hypothetical protein
MFVVMLDGVTFSAFLLNLLIIFTLEGSSAAEGP